MSKTRLRVDQYLIGYRGWMDLLRHLQQFVVVAEELHFGHAADRLGMAQPPLSQRIRRLEQELGAPLFDRTSRRVRLTEAGQVLLEDARELLARTERMRNRIARAQRGELGRVRVGVPPDIAGRMLAALLTEITEKHPDIRLDLQEVTTSEQIRLLADRQLDLGLLQHPADTVGLQLGPTIDTPLGVVLRRDSPLATRSEIALDELSGEGLILFPCSASPGLYDTMLAQCREHGFHPTHISHARNPEFVLGLVIAGQGIAFDQGSIAQKEARVVWRPLTDSPIRWRMSFAWPTESAHPAANQLARTAARVLKSDGVSHAIAEDSTVDRPWTVIYRSIDQ